MQKLQHSRLLGSLMPRATSEWATGLELLIAMMGQEEGNGGIPAERTYVKRAYRGQSALACIGSGHYGSVWRYKDSVFKVMTDERDGARAYLEWCMKNPSQFAPTVKHLHTLRNGTMIAVLEPLQEYRDNEYDPFDSDYEYSKGDLEVGVRNFVVYDKELSLALRSLDGFEEFLLALKETGLHNVYYFDVHPGNFMFREDGTPVLNDPLAGVNC